MVNPEENTEENEGKREGKEIDKKSYGLPSVTSTPQITPPLTHSL